MSPGGNEVHQTVDQARFAERSAHPRPSTPTEAGFGAALRPNSTSRHPYITTYQLPYESPEQKEQAAAALAPNTGVGARHQADRTLTRDR